MRTTKSLLTLAVMLGGVSAAVNHSQAQDWTLTSAPITNWSCVASSADGSNLVAAVNTGPIYLSTDAGATWTAASAPGATWGCLASSSDGSVLLAGTSDGDLYGSTDAGTTWAPLPSGISTNGWVSVASSADGGILMAIPAPGLAVMASTDLGLTWTNLMQTVIVPGGSVYSRIACSADGRKLAIDELNYSIYDGATVIALRTNSGSGLSVSAPGTSAHGLCAAVVCSAEGTKLAAIINTPPQDNCPGRAFYSWDSGVTWTNACLLGGRFNSLACSANGTRLFAVGTSDTIFSSTDAGMDWTSTTVPYGNWSSVATSADGARAVAVVQGGGIYTWQTTPPPPPLTVTPSGHNLVIAWPVPSMTFVLQQNPGLAASDWTDVLVTPAFDNSTLQDFVKVPVGAGRMFYRLVLR
jgi:photosystem II stability/assembly factor-like uncharacterized protein